MDAIGALFGLALVAVIFVCASVVLIACLFSMSQTEMDGTKW